MNRSERRRQQKIAEKAATNAPSLANQNTLSLAVENHRAGLLSKAESLYQQILKADPNHPDALHLLGVVACQTGQYDRAVDLITKSLVLKHDHAEAHYNLANAFKELGQFDEAVVSYRKALAINPNYAMAHNNLGFTLNELKRFDEAITSYQNALSIQPNFVEAHNNLGNTLQDLGKIDEAIESYRKALAFNPGYAMAHNNLGNTLQNQGKLDEAIESYRKALAINPDFAMAYNNLGSALRDLGDVDEALKCYRRAISLDPPNDAYWSGLAESLEAISFTSYDDNLCQDLLVLLDRPTTRPSYLVQTVISALRHHPSLSQILERTDATKPETRINYEDTADQLSAIPLLLRIMELSPIDELDIERMLTTLRRAMLQNTETGTITEKSLPFSAALALQCFSNEYIFFETDAETKSVENLQKRIEVLVENGGDIPPLLVVALSAYRPLLSFSWASNLCERDWNGNPKGVIKRQIAEPLEERSLRAQIPCITPIQNQVSQSVREQYEENPYPRWIKTGLQSKSRSIDAVLKAPPLLLDMGDTEAPENPEILVAGCGTGQHALNAAVRFSNARVLAVDLSLNSLSYAQRKTNELGFKNIEYVQGDIMELGSLGRQFDLIESCGVLHHLGDPIAGWQVLVDLLRPGGVMKIALYSEAARQDIVDGRLLISEKGYTSSHEDICKCRQEMIRMAEGGNSVMGTICNGRDFFSLSNCRDLLFHVQEHRFTVPQIQSALKDLKLNFLGFEIRDQAALRMFKETYPQKHALTSLPDWHDFERANPYTFRGMYQFWCKKNLSMAG